MSREAQRRDIPQTNTTPVISKEERLRYPLKTWSFLWGYLLLRRSK
jgi:hypothetical protein